MHCGQCPYNQTPILRTQNSLLTSFAMREPLAARFHSTSQASHHRSLISVSLLHRKRALEAHYRDSVILKRIALNLKLSRNGPEIINLKQLKLFHLYPPYGSQREPLTQTCHGQLWDQFSFIRCPHPKGHTSNTMLAGYRRWVSCIV